MNLVAITLTEREQKVILQAADEVAAARGTRTPWEEIARKIRQAQEDLWEVPADTERSRCGICGVPQEAHGTHHKWQWLKPREQAERVRE